MRNHRARLPRAPRPPSAVAAGSSPSPSPSSPPPCSRDSSLPSAKVAACMEAVRTTCPSCGTEHACGAAEDRPVSEPICADSGCDLAEGSWRTPTDRRAATPARSTAGGSAARGARTSAARRRRRRREERRLTPCPSTPPLLATRSSTPRARAGADGARRAGAHGHQPHHAMPGRGRDPDAATEALQGAERRR